MESWAPAERPRVIKRVDNIVVGGEFSGKDIEVWVAGERAMIFRQRSTSISTEKLRDDQYAISTGNMPPVAV